MVRDPLSAGDLIGGQAQPVEEVAEGILNVRTFGNIGCVLTKEEVAVIDTGTGQASGRQALEELRARTSAPVRYIVYTHGHFDHAFGVQPFRDDAEASGRPWPTIVAHRDVPRRFNRYRELYAYHERINRIQFGIPEDHPVLPRDFFYPDVTYADSMSLRLGGLTLKLHHAMGETDDATWAWVPERRVAFAGDLFVWSCPNIGNPFKVQRYEVEWAEALERVASFGPEAMVPGHGPTIAGRERVQEACLDTARALRYLHDEVVRRLNEGQWHEQILAEVRDLPEDLREKPYLQPVYGCPTFIVHGILRRYTGWHDGNPGRLFPSRSAAIAAEVVALAGGAEALLRRAEALKAQGEVQLALHLVDFALEGGSADSRAHALKAELLQARADAEPSFIARNIFAAGARREREAAGG